MLDVEYVSDDRKLGAGGGLADLCVPKAHMQLLYLSLSVGLGVISFTHMGRQSQCVLCGMPFGTAIQALDLVETLTRMIIQNPSEEKFRRLRCANEKLQPIFGTAQGRAVMAEMGWKLDESSEALVLSQQQARKLDFPQHIAKILDTKSYFGKQIEKEKNAKRNAGMDKNKTQLLQEIQNDRRERGATEKLKVSKVSHAPPQPVTLQTPSVLPAFVPPNDERELQQNVWSCQLCTYENSGSLSQCEMCGGEKPGVIAVAEPGLTAPKQQPAHEPSLVHKTVVSGNTQPQKCRKTAYDFELRTSKADANKDGEWSLAEMRREQAEKYKSNPNPTGLRPFKAPNSTSASTSASSNSDGSWWNFFGGSGSSDKPAPASGGGRVKTLADPPKPQRG